MPPKPRPTHKAASKTTKAIDEFLAQSSVPAGQQQILENKRLEEESQAKLKEKFIDLHFGPRVALNQDLVNKSRVIANIFAGVAAGILGLGAFQGILFWIAVALTTSLVLFVQIQVMSAQGEGATLFQSVGKAATQNLLSNVMTYMLFWIMFYNVVYVV
uniref:ER membrane protein complex subunit 6 n=1 Tax=Strombidium rassoulzadegani TaxID=1082188 RepID=A0A7S3CSG6_9SPIT